MADTRQLIFCLKSPKTGWSCTRERGHDGPCAVIEENTAYYRVKNRPGEIEMLEANDLVNGDRQADYGSPSDNYRDIAAVWTGILGVPVTARQAALMMVGLKLAREAHKPKRDNVVDAHGYLLVYSHIGQDGE